MSHNKAFEMAPPIDGTKEVYHNEPSFDVETGSTSSLHGKLNKYASRFRMEETGFEHVPPEDQNERSLVNAGTMWLSANLNISSFAIGALGITLFFVGFWDGVAAIIFFNAISILPVCYYSTFGSQLGLRQMIISRYSFGILGTPVVAALNVLACIGWSASNAIVGAQILKAIGGDFPLWAGILIITLVTGFITIFGYKIVHMYEKVSWIPSIIIFFILIAGIKQSGAFVTVPMGTGANEAGAILSFGSAIYGFGTGWTSYAADYTIFQNRSVKKWKIFAVTYAGLFFPLVFCEIVGLAAGTLTMNEANTIYSEAYESNSVGGLTGRILDRYHGGGKFCLVVLALSVIANNVPNNYSGALSAQAILPWFAKIPRYLWNILITLIILAVAIPAANHFALFFKNLLNVLAYWLAIYAVVLLEEHLLFRKGFAGYDVRDWNNFARLPLGLGAIAALCAGVAGMVLGMYQVYWEGPIAHKIGEFGGDVGFELSFAFAGLVYPLARTLELKFIGR
ncbi:Purine-cytosine permease [Taphrina deformans PYCC 5710]|uniref:Purine-cytosine permease n=1 Tax=Taphrina deformans (strain PYCC 5710 / ATCC 11124 / CBS 356.35 / IMI 108563 / JCM 9778 / NBRC 8474) TaxID=1097556 RepID=R4X7F8_TAPDE|nr:Purine-cytosine permease [Taphrina deformans PYCC 5710]|eukprot:CCG81326.1 Purine-cytosine permease [Taphrina deformans PYCC 5710]